MPVFPLDTASHPAHAGLQAALLSCTSQSPGFPLYTLGLCISQRFHRGVTACWHANMVLAQPPASRQGPRAEAPRGLLEEHTRAATHRVLVTAGQSTPFMPYSQHQAFSGRHHSRGLCHVLEHRDRGTVQEVHQTKADSGSGLRYQAAGKPNPEPGLCSEHRHTGKTELSHPSPQTSSADGLPST